MPRHSIRLLGAAALLALLAGPALAGPGDRPVIAQTERHVCVPSSHIYASKPLVLISSNQPTPLASPLAVEIDATDYDGVAEDDRGWYDAGQGRIYRVHVRSSVAHSVVPCGTPDYWAYRAHIWCTGETASLSYLTSCNMDVERASLRLKGCQPWDTCTSSMPWGEGPWHRDNDEDYTRQGAWHQYGTSEQANSSLLSASADFQVRFLASTGDHLTADRDACSYWVMVGNHDFQSAAACTGILG